jgi:hypothetical protein
MAKRTSNLLEPRLVAREPPRPHDHFVDAYPRWPCEQPGDHVGDVLRPQHDAAKGVLGGSDLAFQIGVSTGPGLTRWTRTPVPSHSSAIASWRARTPNFEAA